MISIYGIQMNESKYFKSIDVWKYIFVHIFFTGAVVFAEIAGMWSLINLNFLKSDVLKFSPYFSGKIECCVRLSGTPDLTLSFVNPRLLDDVSFHPCIRFKRWENERILSFVPPDGNFCLMNYHVSCQSAVAIPVYIRHTFFLPKESNQSQTGKLEMTVGPRQTMGRVVSWIHFWNIKVIH